MCAQCVPEDQEETEDMGLERAQRELEARIEDEEAGDDLTAETFWGPGSRE